MRKQEGVIAESLRFLPDVWGSLGVLEDLGTTPLLPDVRADRYCKNKIKQNKIEVMRNVTTLKRKKYLRGKNRRKLLKDKKQKKIIRYQ